MNIRMWIICCLAGFGMAVPVDAPAYETALNHVVIVLDGSGSMDEMMPASPIKKINAAKEALIQVMEKIDPDTRVGLLVFSSSNLTDEWVYPLGPLDKEQLKEAILLPLPGGQTPLGAYIKIASDRLLEEREKQFGYGTYRLLIVTDGEAQDQNRVNAYTPDVISRGITMDVIGVAMKSDHTLATRVHSYRRADDPDSLAKALIEVLAEVGGSGKDIESEEIFKEISTLPDGLAEAMLKALSVSGNHPIGQKPKVLMDVGMDQPLIDPPREVQPAPAPVPTAEGAINSSEKSTEISDFMIVGAFVLIAVVTVLGSKIRRNRSRYKR